MEGCEGVTRTDARDRCLLGISGTVHHDPMLEGL